MGGLQCTAAAYSAHEKGTPHAQVQWPGNGLTGKAQEFSAGHKSPSRK
jgi:hypothetical protein